MASAARIRSFQKIVWDFYKKNGRHDLPWRTTHRSTRRGASHDPYPVLVSEVMLQQTQVERVIPYYAAWLKKFPTVGALAKAPLSDVLKLWQGLGYNRRAKMLHAATNEIVAAHKGRFPKTVEELESLPGIGPYTARAVAAFSSNEDVIFIETNIRTAVTHHFFSGKKQVADKDIMSILEKALPKGNAREWYAALMDYGSFLKRSGIRINARAKGYVKQSTFEGSLRQARGAILRALLQGPQTGKKLSILLGAKREQQVLAAIAGLTKDGMITLSRGKFRLPS